jgi:hypothetical protein
LGNPTTNRHRVTILLHDFFFGDLAACTFWLPPGLPLSTYSMRSYTTQAWTDATISIYPSTNEATGWLELDNVTLGVTPSAPTYGADCVEPGDASGLSQAPAPAPAPTPAPAPASDPQPAEVPLWTGRLIDRRWLVSMQ